MTATSIYKYFPINQYTLATFLNKKIWFSFPQDFNDPFDCQINADKTCSEASCEQCRYAYGPQCDQFLYALRQLTLDQRIDIKQVAKSTNDQLERVGVSCFSKNKYNILMWSHYADSHKGICVEFEQDTLFNEKIKFSDVKYHESFPFHELQNSLEACEEDWGDNLTPMDTVIAVFSDAILTTKYKAWKDEEEVRAIYTGTDDFKSDGGFIFSPSAIKNVFFGCKTSARDMATIKLLFTGKEFSSVHFFMMKKAADEYSLQSEELVR
ncbi:DUF2971 domain-containing protein [Aeromonas aquatilis]